MFVVLKGQHSTSVVTFLFISKYVCDLVYVTWELIILVCRTAYTVDLDLLHLGVVDCSL